MQEVNVPTMDISNVYVYDVYTVQTRRLPYCGDPTWVSFDWYGLTLIPTLISNNMLGKVWDEITYPFPNINCATVEVWEWISNFKPLKFGNG